MGFSRAALISIEHIDSESCMIGNKRKIKYLPINCHKHAPNRREYRI